MHIIIGLITAIGGLLWALNSLQRSGFSFSSLNPFAWKRRREWRKKYQESPLYSINNPMESAAVLLLGTAKLEGEISQEQKKQILNIFSEEFNLSTNEAGELFASTAYLLQHENNFLKNINRILSKSAEKFSSEQKQSTLELIKRISQIDSDILETQQELINTVSKILLVNNKQEKWSQ